MNIGAPRQADASDAARVAGRTFHAACEAGISMFDHADIYQGGQAEALFGRWLKENPGLRERIVIQSKCGIRHGVYDSSKAHILAAVEASLRRLETSHLDILLLHRPDALMEPEEIAEAFVGLEAAGKVRHFGVSNMNVAQIRLLQHVLPMPLVVNQLEMGLGRLDWLNEGVHVNQEEGAAVHFGDGLLEHCRMHDVQLQAWRPLSQGEFLRPDASGAPARVRETAAVIRRLAAELGVTPEAIVLGWLMRHPAGIQPVIGTTRPERIRACAAAAEIAEELSREDWYELFVAARGRPLP